MSGLRGEGVLVLTGERLFNYFAHAGATGNEEMHCDGASEPRVTFTATLGARSTNASNDRRSKCARRVVVFYKIVHGEKIRNYLRHHRDSKSDFELG